MLMIQSRPKAIMAGILIATAVSILGYFYYQHQAIRALADLRTSGRVDSAAFAAFGYDGLITAVKSPDGDVEIVNMDVHDGRLTPITFSESYVTLMFSAWSRPIWTCFGIALLLAVPLALWMPGAKRFIPVAGWFYVAFGTLLWAGSFVLRRYFGLDGLGDHDSIQIENLFIGAAIALPGLWIARSGPMGILQKNYLIASIKYLIVLLAIAGILVSLKSWRVHNAPAEGDARVAAMIDSCGGPWDCGDAEQSRFSEFLGWPVAGWAVALYTAFLMLMVFDRHRIRQVQFALGLIALIIVIQINFNYSHSYGNTDLIPFTHRFIVDRSEIPQFTASGDSIRPEDQDQRIWWCKYCVISQGLLVLILLSSGLRLALVKEKSNIPEKKTRPPAAVANDLLTKAQHEIPPPMPQEAAAEFNSPPDEYKLPACPGCGGESPTLESVDPVNCWLCESCGKRWSDPAET